MPEQESPPSDDEQARLDLGRALRDLRVGREWTLQELADLTGVSVSSLSAYELGRRGLSIEALHVICRAYGLLVSDFLSGVYPFGAYERTH